MDFPRTVEKVRPPNVPELNVDRIALRLRPPAPGKDWVMLTGRVGKENRDLSSTELEQFRASEWWPFATELLRVRDTFRK